MSDERFGQGEVTALLQQADVMFLQADFVAKAERRGLLADLKDVLLRAEMLLPGSGAWRLARMAAEVGRDDLCQKWLLRAQANGRLPTAEALFSEPGFQSVREKPWFQKILGKSRISGA